MNVDSGYFSCRQYLLMWHIKHTNLSPSLAFQQMRNLEKCGWELYMFYSSHFTCGSSSLERFIGHTLGLSFNYNALSSSTILMAIWTTTQNINKKGDIKLLRIEQRPPNIWSQRKFSSWLNVAIALRHMFIPRSIRKRVSTSLEIPNENSVEGEAVIA